MVQPKVKPTAATQAAAAAANAASRIAPLLSYAQDIPGNGYTKMVAICDAFKPKDAANQIGYTKLCHNVLRKGCTGLPKCGYFHPAPNSDDVRWLVRKFAKEFPDCKFTCA